MLQGMEALQPRPDALELLVDQQVDVAAAGVRLVGKFQQPANIGQPDVQRPAVANEHQVLELPGGIGPVTIGAALRCGHQPDLFVVANGLDVHAGRGAQFAYTHPDLLLTVGRPKKTGLTLELLQGVQWLRI